MHQMTSSVSVGVRAYIASFLCVIFCTSIHYELFEISFSVLSSKLTYLAYTHYWGTGKT